MQTIFQFSFSTLALPLGLASMLALGLLSWRAMRSPYVARLALRNVPRRPGRTLLILAGLMLATTFVSASISVDEAIVRAVENVAVFNLGRVDEDVVGGRGSLGLYSQAVGDVARFTVRDDQQVAGIAPALSIPDLLVTDATSRQVRGGVLGIGLDPPTAGPLGEFRSLASQATAPAATLGPQDAYVNHSLALLLHVNVGDSFSVYSTFWVGKRLQLSVAAIVSGGVLGDRPALVTALTTLQQQAGQPFAINHIYVANAGDGISGVGFSDAIAARLSRALPSTVRVERVKQAGIQFALAAQQTFGRILLFFTLFSLSIGLLLIFLIFTLIAVERRAELGVVRAVGLRRTQVMWLLLFEGAAFDLVAAALGTLAGLGLSVAILALVSPTVQQLGFPLTVTFDPASLLSGFCLGLLVTLATIVLACWLVSRMTIAAALRDLPEPPPATPPVRSLLWSALRASWRPLSAPRAALTAWLDLLAALAARGSAPLVLGAALVYWALGHYDVLALALGLAGVLVGVVLSLRWLALWLLARWLRSRAPDMGLLALSRGTEVADRLSALAIGTGLTLYWALPVDTLRALGLPRFAGDVDELFLAGIMMVFGAVLALVPNLDLIFAPFTWALTRPRLLRPVAPVTLVYPASQRFRTGIGMSLFALICFTMVVMACVTASTTVTSANASIQAIGYDIIGQSLYAQATAPGQASQTLGRASRAASGNLTAASAARPIPIGALEPEAPNARWSLYPAAEVQGDFLRGRGLSLVARAPGFATDAEVWSAVSSQPGDVVVDIGALSPQDAATLGVELPPSATAAQYFGPPLLAGVPQLSDTFAAPGLNLPAQNRLQLLSDFAAVAADQTKLDEFSLRLRYVITGPHAIAPTTLWIGDLRGGPVERVTVIGLAADPSGLQHGLFASPATFAPIEAGQPPFGNEYFYFAVRPGVDPHAVAYAIGAALLARGFETTVVQDVLVDVNGPRLFISRVLLGLVGITLLVGTAALVVIGSRAVVERRQQIGTLRALGFHRSHVEALFAIEALLIGSLGTGLGLALGLLLCRNAFAVGFFDQFRTGLALVVPGAELAIVCGAAMLAALVAAIAPARQAGKVVPAEALRYE